MSKPSETQQRKHIVVVGAGQIGAPVVERLARAGQRVTWCSRTKPASMPMGVEHVSLDACDGAALAAVARGAHAIIAAVNPATYDARVWAETLPPLHRGLIAGASQAGVRLVLLDALYLYTTREGPLAPHTRHAAETEKGKIRMQIAELYAEAQRKGTLRCAIYRASDFWGPDLTSALLTRETLAGLKQGKRPLLIGNPDVPHAFTHRDDVVDGLITLAFAEDDVEGRVFHAPVIQVTQRELAQAFASAAGVKVRPMVAPRWLLRVIGLF